MTICLATQKPYFDIDYHILALLILLKCLILNNWVTLGFVIFSGAINITDPSFFSEGLNPAALGSVGCLGTESNLLSCDHQRFEEVLSCETAGVVCQG